MKPCIVCGGSEVTEFLDLGKTALANKFPPLSPAPGREAQYPLRVGFCPACGHVQLTDHVPPPAMFVDYLYMSSMSDTTNWSMSAMSNGHPYHAIMSGATRNRAQE